MSLDNRALRKKAIQFDKKSYKRFIKALRKASKKVDDLRIPLNEIANRFMESRKFIFDLSRSGPGAYQDLSDKYKKWKTRLIGTPYPILYLTGRLKESITKEGRENIKNVRPKLLEIGSTVPYALYLQKGSKKINLPAREFLFWGPESPKFANHHVVRKQNRATAMVLYTFIERKLGKTLPAAISDAERKVDRIFQ